MNIETIGVCKYFNEFKLEDINIKVPCGKIVGLIGENGAGKTTLIKCILRIMKIDKGCINLFDGKFCDELKEDIGVVFDNSFVNEKYDVNDINFIMKNIYKKWDEELFFKYMKEYKIPFRKELKKLSVGMRKKIEIAVVLSHHPRILILDEPTSGLDPIARSEVLDMFCDFVSNGINSILLSTHITSDLEHIADFVLFISNGRIVFEKSIDEIHQEYRLLVVDKDLFKGFNKKIIIRYKENKNDYQILINNKDMIDEYNKYVCGITTLDDIMLLYIRGSVC